MRSVALAFVPLLLLAQAAQAADPPQCIPPPQAEGVFRYVIDLTDGSNQGKSRYRPEDEVEIVLTNKNPFLFDYRIKIEEQAIPEPALQGFFALFGLPNASDAARLAALPAVSVMDASDPKISLACRNALANEKVKKLSTQQVELRKAYETLQEQAKDVDNLLGALKSEVDVQEKKLKDPAAACSSLVEAASNIVAAVKKRFGDTSDAGLPRKIAQLEEGLKKLTDLVETQTKSITEARTFLTGSGCTPQEIKDGVGDFELVVDLLGQNLSPKNPKGLRSVITDLQTGAREAQEKAKGIEEILQRPQNFLETRQVGNYDEITLVTVTVDVTPKSGLSAPPPPAKHIKKLRFGGRQRFALAAGAAFTPLDYIKFGMVQGVELNAEGNPVGSPPNIKRVVGFEEESSQRVSPLIMLHTRLREGSRWNSGYHFSFGFAGNIADGGVNLEYLVGPAISFAEERFFITLGAYNGRTEELRDGFFLGQPLPDLITSPPVVKGRDWDWGFALTYKFR